jgi:hypothetical protein
MNKKILSKSKIPGLKRETLVVMTELPDASLRAVGGGSVGMSCCGECTGSGFLSCIKTR